MSAGFDRYQETYADEVERAIAFAGTDAAFFTELKAADLVSLSKRRLGPSSDVNALDFGCGTGALDALLLPHVGSVTGIDVSSGLLEVARTSKPGRSLSALRRRRDPVRGRIVRPRVRVVRLPPHRSERAGQLPPRNWRGYCARAACSRSTSTTRSTR